MEQFEGQNWGIIKCIKIIARDNVVFSESSNPINFNRISTQNDANFENIPFIFESAGFWEQEKTSDAGNYWDKKIVLTIPKIRSDVDTFLKNYESRKLVLIVTDMNDISSIVYPLRMLRQPNIPGQAVSLNATRIEFSGNYMYKSAVVTNVT